MPDSDEIERATVVLNALPADELAGWRAAEPMLEAPTGRFERDAAATCAYLQAGERLVARLPTRATRSEAEQDAAATILGALHAARERFLRVHAERVHATVGGDSRTRPLRIEELCARVAERFPGLAPTAAQVAAEREHGLADQDGVQIARGLLVAHVLSAPHAGRHLVWSMLRPTEAAAAAAEEFAATGELDLDRAHIRRQDRAGVLELRNPRHLNAEDDSTLPPTELAVDVLLLDPAVEVCVLRGGKVEHPRYAGRRIFGSGINLTQLYRGQIAFDFFTVRDMGYVNKIYRGLSAPEHHLGELEETTEKLWIAAAETYAIGGACQLLHVMDHVIAERGTRLYLPARREGIIPGASNLRLPRAVGDRIARQAIVSGREFEAGEPDADLLVDEVVERGAMDAAVAARVAALTTSGLVNAAANRRAIRIGQEPLDLFRTYMATYSREQAFCHFSPALVHNLERNWDAQNRSVR